MLYFHNVLDLKLRVAAEVAVSHVVQIVIVDCLLHDLLEALDLLEDLLLAAVIRVMHLQRFSESALEVLRLV